MPTRANKTNQGARKSMKGQEVPNFTESEARDYFERMRWGDQPSCCHCASVNVYRLGGESTRNGLLECRDCRKQFTVTVNTVMEDTHLPLSTWAKAFHLVCSSKKGMSALQLQRNLGLGSYRTAWFLAHRIREAMKCEPVAGMLKGQVQADECYIGGKPRPGDGRIHKRGRGTEKAPVVVLVETDGKARSKAVANVTASTLYEAMAETVDFKAEIVTDDFAAYPAATAAFGGHETVNHGKKQYARKRINALTGEVEAIHTNTAESYIALIKRGVYGTFHHISKQHLHRYCTEFDFRWNGREVEDSERRDLAVQGAEGKRLYYKQPIGEA